MTDHWDVAVVGGGPGGCTYAILAAQAGLRVLLLEKQEFPRWQIGESLLPENVPLLKRLGVFDSLEKGPYLKKWGAVFTDESTGFSRKVAFGEALECKADHAFQVLREPFDQLFLERAREVGVTIEQPATVEGLRFEGDRLVEAHVRDASGGTRPLHCTQLVDATGRGVLIGRTRGSVKPDPTLNQTSAFTYYDRHNPCDVATPGDIEILQTHSAWVWLIPLANNSVSVGAVWTKDQIRAAKRNPAQMFDDLIEESPALRSRLEGSTRLRETAVVADYSYAVEEVVGPNWVCIGDAAAFVDPVFSAGVFLSTVSSEKAADLSIESLRRGEDLPTAAQEAYVTWLVGGVSRFTEYIYGYYTPGFRRLLYSDPPLRVLRRAITSILAGNVFEPSRLTRLCTWVFWQGVKRQTRKIEKAEKRKAAVAGNA